MILVYSLSDDMTARGPDDIPEIPARRVGIASLAGRPGTLVLASDTTGRTVGRIEELLASGTAGRGWSLEPIDDFPHFERDVRRLFGHALWRRPGMELSPTDIAMLVPIVRMLSATERWTTGVFTSTGLADAEARLDARESNLGHIVGMLDTVEAHYDELLALLGSTAAIRELVRMIVGHDLPEFPKGDHSRSESTGLDERERLRAAWQKHREETEAVDMIVGRARRASFAAMLRSPMERYDAGKPKRYTMDTAHRGDIVAFMTKFIDLCQGTEHGCERIFVRYAQGGRADGHLALHLEEGVEELGAIGSKIMRLVAYGSPERAELAADILRLMAEPSIARSRSMADGIP